MIKLRLLAIAALFLGLAGAPMLRAQATAETSGSASPSVMSGQRSEPEATKEDPAEALKKPSASVTKIGGMVGMKPAVASMAFQWLNFLVLAAAVGYALVKALPKAFRGRTENIQKNLVEARVATEEARLRLAAVEFRLGRLDDEIAVLRKENDNAAAEEEARVHAQLEDEKKRIVEAAEQEITAASNAAQQSLRAYAAEIAVDRAAQQLQITPDDDRLLIESFASRLNPEGSRN